MHRLTRTLAVAAFATAVAFGAVPASLAGQPPAGSDPCAKDEAHLAKAQDALARVTAVFAKQQQHVAAAHDALALASTHAQQVHAQQALAHARAHKNQAKKAKTAQQQRFSKDQQRLDQCQAAGSTS
jgi:hypothetical protein